MKIFYPSEQTRSAVINAYQGNATPIGWVLNGAKAGYVFNPSGSPNRFVLVADVAATLTAISPSTGILVMGNSGISVIQGIYSSTYQGMLSDDYVASQLVDEVKFETGSIVQG